jgi:hypothetical protein
MVQNIFGLIVPGQPVITDFVPSDSSGLKFLLTLPFAINSSPALISDLVIFLLPGISLPGNSGALIYWSAAPIYANATLAPNSTGFEMLGALTPAKPSGVFRTGWSTNEALIQLLQQQQSSGGGVSITLGISIEPIVNISNIPGVENNGVENRGDIAKKIALDLFQYLQSFDDAGSRRGLMSVPTNIFERWYRRFEEKLGRDPSFFMKNSE